MNIFALTDLQRLIAKRISQITKKDVIVARYVDIADSFHIYGAYFNDFKNFLNLVAKREFKDRTWTSDFAKAAFEDARQQLEAEKR
jgi:thymidylate synthase